MEPPIGLLEKIIKRIHKEERFLAFKKLFIFSVMFVVSVIGLVPSFKILSSDFNSSGFFQFSSLIFSDFSSVLIYWQSFAMILLETIPAISLAIFLTMLLALLQSTILLTKNIKFITNNNHLAHI